MKLLIENWRKLLEGEVVDFPSEATAAERYKSYLAYMDNAIEQIRSLENIFEHQYVSTEELIHLRESLESLRNDKMLKLDVEGAG